MKNYLKLLIIVLSLLIASIKTAGGETFRVYELEKGNVLVFENEMGIEVFYPSGYMTSFSQIISKSSGENYLYLTIWKQLQQTESLTITISVNIFKDGFRVETRSCDLAKIKSMISQNKSKNEIASKTGH